MRIDTDPQGASWRGWCWETPIAPKVHHRGGDIVGDGGRRWGHRDRGGFPMPISVVVSPAPDTASSLSLSQAAM